MIRHFSHRGTDRSSPSHGFTLIEISVVLLIIGLLTAGVLVGRDLIESSKIRATIGQYQEFTTALQAFRLKYECLPGDCPDAAQLGFDATSAGNGDGLVGQCSSPLSERCSFGLSGNTQYWETLFFWYQLSAAGLIKEQILLPTSINFLHDDAGVLMNCGMVLSQPNMPAPKFDRLISNWKYAQKGAGWGIQGDLFFQAADGTIERYQSHTFIMAPFAVIGGSSSCTTATGGFHPMRIAQMDTKLDDGLPFSGSFRVLGRWRTDLGTQRVVTAVIGATPATGNCTFNDGGVPKYNVTYSDNYPMGYCSAAIMSGSN